MKFADNKKIYLRRAAFVVLIIVTAVFQNTKGAVPSINGVQAFLLVPLVVAIGMFEKNIAALAFGTFAGIMWDSMSISTDGYFTVILGCVCFFSSVFIVFIMRNNIFSSFILSLISIFICNTLYWVLFFLIKGYDSAFYVYFRYYFSSVIYTCVFSFVYYGLVKLICELTAPEKKRITY